MDELSGLVFLGYPLHPPGRPEQLRSEHLPRIGKPMLFVQGANDAFGTVEELRPIIKKLKPAAQLHAIAGGDHSFKVPKKSAIPQDQVYLTAQQEIRNWLQKVMA
jgi:predicted alpha/beta-hydrolase family hydrolase